MYLLHILFHRGHSHSTYARRRGGGGREKAYVCVRGGRGVLLGQVRTHARKIFALFQVFEWPQISDIHENIIKITLFIMHIFYYKTNLIHFRDAKLFRVGLKFTNVPFARVRQI